MKGEMAAVAGLPLVMNSTEISGLSAGPFPIGSYVSLLVSTNLSRSVLSSPTHPDGVNAGRRDVDYRNRATGGGISPLPIASTISRQLVAGASSVLVDGDGERSILISSRFPSTPDIVIAGMSELNAEVQPGSRLGIAHIPRQRCV